MILKNNLAQIVDKLNGKSLPGEIAHKEMSTVCRDISLRGKCSKVKEAEVLFLLIESKNIVYFPLIKRTTYRGNHSGEIGLPGGKTEIFDKNVASTALRETEEELGVDSSEIKIIQSLSSIYIPISDFLVTPYVGTFSGKINPEHLSSGYIPKSTEVEDVFNVSLCQLLDQRNRTKVSKDKENIHRLTPAFRFGKYVVWGATACVLNEFRHLLNDSL